MSKGIDISEHQTGIDYATLSKSIEFAVLREGTGTRQDYMFRTHLAAFRALKITIPAIYHFIEATNPDKARQEADSCVRNLEAANLGKDVFIFSDYEYHSLTLARNAGISITRKDCNEIVLAFCEEIAKLGYKPGIYTNLDFITNWYFEDTLSKYPLWIALYGEVRPKRDCLFWQYSKDGRLDGYEEDLDLDMFYDDIPIEEDELTDGTDVAEKAVSWMEALAEDPSHGYDQTYRWGEKGDYDCSSALITAWENTGVPVKSVGKATYTGNMKEAFLKCGFTDVTDSVDLATGEGLQRSDVLLNEIHHTAMYCGDGLEVEASINERGTATGGTPGDQTGREILVRPYRDYPWDCVLRYGKDGCDGGACTIKYPAEHTFKVYTVRNGSVGRSVKLLQVLLRGNGCVGANGNSLIVDGEFGRNTEHALKTFQISRGLEVDGICGAKTWAAITEQ